MTRPQTNDRAALFGLSVEKVVTPGLVPGHLAAFDVMAQRRRRPGQPLSRMRYGEAFRRALTEAARGARAAERVHVQTRWPHSLQIAHFRETSLSERQSRRARLVGSQCRSEQNSVAGEQNRLQAVQREVGQRVRSFNLSVGPGRSPLRCSAAHGILDCSQRLAGRQKRACRKTDSRIPKRSPLLW